MCERLAVGTRIYRRAVRAQSGQLDDAIDALDRALNSSDAAGKVCMARAHHGYTVVGNDRWNTLAAGESAAYCRI